MTVMRCPHCGGEVSFDPEGQDIRCEYCDSILSIDDYRNYLDSKGMYQANELVCSQCGASIISTDATVATFCSFCGSPLVLDSRIREEKKPDLIIPFRVKKAAAVKKYREKIQNTLLAPDWMSDDDSIEKFRGIYMPFHLFRYSGNGVYRGKATSNKVEKINGEKYDVTRTYLIEAPAEVDYDEIPADASASFPDPMSRALSPYRSKYMEEFQLPYLSGYYADGNDVSADLYGPDYEKIARSDMKSRDGIKADKLSVVASDVLQSVEVKQSTKSALFPAWFLSFRNGDRISYAAVNGDTGELAVDIPIDFRKYLTASVIVAGAVSVILNLFFTITPISFMTVASILSVITYFTADRLLDETYRQSKHIDDAGYTGKNEDKVVTRSAWQKGMAVFGTILTGLVIILLALILAALGKPGAAVIAGIAPIVIISTVIVKCVIELSTDIRIRKKKATVFYKFLTLIKPTLAVFACAAVYVMDRNSDMLCYGAGIVSILMTVWTALDIVRAQNRLTMRDIPLFTGKRGGDV